MIGWALRCLMVWGGVTFICIVIAQRYHTLVSQEAAIAPPPAAVVAERYQAPPPNTLVFRADRGGHVIVDATVNGASTRLLVDTGSTLVALTPEDARAAGISPETLVFDHRAQTANGPGRMALVTLREVRIGQLSLYDVPAAVMEHLPVSLLGMSFLGRLESWQMADGRLTITW
jgi:clan AA aspartic protease (TIGR02281 family)